MMKNDERNDGAWDDSSSRDGPPAGAVPEASGAPSDQDSFRFVVSSLRDSFGFWTREAEELVRKHGLTQDDLKLWRIFLEERSRDGKTLNPKVYTAHLMRQYRCPPETQKPATKPTTQKAILRPPPDGISFGEFCKLVDVEAECKRMAEAGISQVGIAYWRRLIEHGLRTGEFSATGARVGQRMAREAEAQGKREAWERYRTAKGRNR